MEVGDVVEVPPGGDVVLDLLLLLLLFLWESVSERSREPTAMLAGVQVSTVLHCHLGERGGGEGGGEGGGGEEGEREKGRKSKRGG